MGMNFANHIRGLRNRPCQTERRIIVSPEHWERLAREWLDPRSYIYAATGAGEGATIRSNREAFDRWFIMQRLLRDVSNRKLAVNLLGETYPFPVGIAPVGRQAMFHEHGEVASARAAAALGIPFVLSMVSTYSLEEVAATGARRWFHLFIGQDRDVVRSLVNRAEKAGYTAIVPSLDRPEIGWRTMNLDYCVPSFMFRFGLGNFITDPVVRNKYGSVPTPQVISHLTENPRLDAGMFRFLRSITKLPIIAKGLVHPADAVMLADYGADAVIVSNHGGRHLDGAVAALDALPHIVEKVGHRMPVLFDSGIRYGADIVKALSLGARMVFIGRPFVYGLAVAGESGVRQVMENTIADLDATLGIAGIRDVHELNPDVLRRADR